MRQHYRLDMDDTLYVGATGDGIFKSGDLAATWIPETSYPAEAACNSNITDLLAIGNRLFASNNNCGVALKNTETDSWNYYRLIILQQAITR